MKGKARVSGVLILSSIIMLGLASTAVASIIVDNSYSVSASYGVPEIHLSVAGANGTGDSSVVGQYGSYVNVTLWANYTLASLHALNFSRLLSITSTSSYGFSFLTNITSFNGAAFLSTAALYSDAGNSTYQTDFAYSNTSGTFQSNEPVIVQPEESSFFGVCINASDYAIGYHSWNLNFAVDGSVSAAGNLGSVYFQYYVNIAVIMLATT